MAASTTPPAGISRDQPLSSSSPPLPASVRPPTQLQHQEELVPDSEFELDSPPRLTFIHIPDYEEPGIPTSPPGRPPPSIDVEPPVLPTFGSHAEEWHYSDAEDDPYFESLVDNFVIADRDVCKTPEDNIDNKAANPRQADRYAESALKYYNNNENNKVKYDLISAVTSCGMIDVERCYGHVNFIAKGNQENSKEERFFAEIQLDTYVPTCVLSLEGMKRVGGLRESKYDNKFRGKGFPIDAQHCYACRSGVMHPKNGTLYESGHAAFSSYYHG